MPDCQIHMFRHLEKETKIPNNKIIPPSLRLRHVSKQIGSIYTYFTF